jgi:Putative transposase, YhgA-like
VFKILPVATQLLRKFLKPDQLSVIDLDTLQLVSESFVSEDLHSSFSDLVYTCESLGKGDSVRICLLFEHKSGSTGRYIYGQMGRYLVKVWKKRSFLFC